MNKLFVKKSELSLVNGGYLVTTEKQIPVFHSEFIEAQRNAEFLITLAKEAKGKDFKGKEAADFNKLADSVRKNLSTKKKVTYLEEPKAPVAKISDSLKKEAMAFIEHSKETETIAKLNQELSGYDIINQFEEFGLYFDDSEIVQLNKIYTIAEIKGAMLELKDLL